MPLFRSKEPVIAEQFNPPYPQCDYPKGVCDCGRTMRGIAGGCDPHVHGIDGSRNYLSPKDWVIPELNGQGGRKYFIMSDQDFRNKYEPLTD